MAFNLPIGYDNFRELIANKLDFVDKTLLIKELIDNKSIKIRVILRPRRFGKTLNLSMLHHFLASEVNGRSTFGLFDGLKIMAMGEEYSQHQSKYPVIFITFKDIKNLTFEEVYANLAGLMSSTYLEHAYLLNSDKLLAYQKEAFEVILKQNASRSDLVSALFNLTQILHQHHGVNAWLLIDEYDSPIKASYLRGYYDEMKTFMQSLLGKVLKTNPYLERTVITGILRVSKESLFSGLNNLEVYSTLEAEYAEYFGFTEAEMADLLEKAGLQEQAEGIKRWYNGYQIGETILYNPWSIAHCIQKKGELEPYWVNTSDNQLIRDLLIRSTSDFKTQFESLMQGETIEQPIDKNIVFADIQTNESTVWSLLLMAGYLKVISKRNTEQGTFCVVKIPNEEIRRLYRQIIEQWLSDGRGIIWYNAFLESLLIGDLERFEGELRRLMEETASFHDTAQDPAAFYHGLMIGLTASLCRNENYEIQSNRESGYGRYDYMIFSPDKDRPSLVLEFKKVEAAKDLDTLSANLEEAAIQALAQIDEKRYAAEAEKRGCSRVLKLGLAFSGKRFALRHAYAG